VMKLTFDKGSRNAKCPNKPHEDRSDSSNGAPTHNFNGYHISVRPSQNPFVRFFER
jgi:hypothetical protein